MIWKLPQAVVLIVLGIAGAVIAFTADLVFIAITIAPVFFPFIVMVAEEHYPWEIASPLLDVSVRLIRNGMKEITS